jgi:hypothetical protein
MQCRTSLGQGTLGSVARRRHCISVLATLAVAASASAASSVFGWPNVRCSRHSACHAVEPAADLCASRSAAHVLVRS